MSENKSVQDTKQPKTDEELAQDFIKEYDELVAKHQMRIVANPAFLKRDDDTFSVVLQISVGKLPK